MKIPAFTSEIYNQTRQGYETTRHTIALAAEIQARWHALGHKDVLCWPEIVPGHASYLDSKGKRVRAIPPAGEVCSNLIGGLPPSANPGITPRTPNGDRHVK